MNDYAFLGDRRLIANLAALNEQVSRLVVRLLDADAGRAEPVSVADEQTFAASLRVMADRMQERVNRHGVTSPGTPAGSVGTPPVPPTCR